MDRFEELMSVIDYALNTKKKRHIIGGTLMSVSLLFGGLAVTIFTLRMEDKKDE